MFTGATKIVKPEGQEADEFEQQVAQELFNLEVREGHSLRLWLWYICIPCRLNFALAWHVCCCTVEFAASGCLCTFQPALPVAHPPLQVARIRDRDYTDTCAKFCAVLFKTDCNRGQFMLWRGVDDGCYRRTPSRLSRPVLPIQFRQFMCCTSCPLLGISQ